LVGPFTEQSDPQVEQNRESAAPDGVFPNSNARMPTPGDDRIEGETANGIIDGGGGFDTLVLRGDQASYSLHFAEGSILIENRGTGDAPLAASNIERIDFDREIAPFAADGVPIGMFDGMRDLDGASVMALTELYIAYFNRAPDAVGLYFWGDQMAAGLGLREIATYFFDQPETRALYGSLDDMSSFVTAVYTNVLGRMPDAEGQAYWLDVLESGTDVTPPSFIHAILAGAKAETGSAADAAYLASKVALGGHFAVTRGMSDVENAGMIMQGFDGTDPSLAASLAHSDRLYSDIMDGIEDGFLMQIVGMTDTPFAM
jgi:hypothetical protein